MAEVLSLTQCVLCLVTSHRLRAHEVVRAGPVPPRQCPDCGHHQRGHVYGRRGTAAGTRRQPQLHPHSGPQTLRQAPLPLAQGALQLAAPWCRAGSVTGRREKEPAAASGAASAPRGVLGVREHQRLGRQQDQGHGHLRQRGDGAPRREYQQCQQEAVLLWDDVPALSLQRLGLPRNWRQALELLLHQLTHFCTSSDFLEKPGGLEAHTYQRGLRVRAQPQVLATVTTSPAQGTHTQVHTGSQGQYKDILVLTCRQLWLSLRKLSPKTSHSLHKVNYWYVKVSGLHVYIHQAWVK